MRLLILPLMILLAGCAAPVAHSASAVPVASACPMMHGGVGHGGAGMAMATPSDSASAHQCQCPMHARMHPDSSAAAHPAVVHAATDSTHAMTGCPMCAGGGCPMHAASPPAAGTHSH